MSLGKTATLSSGHKIPTLGYGTWQSAPGDVGNGVYEALKVGYRHLDLAKVYQNQKEVGEGIRRALNEIVELTRQDIFITSKLWNTSHRPEHVEAALYDTLAELDLDYLDLYLIHWPVAFPKEGGNLFPKKPGNDKEVRFDQGVTPSDTWKAMTQLPKSKARSVGVSNFTIEQMEAIINDTGIIPSVLQIERHPKLPGDEIIAYCNAKNIHVTGYSPFGNNNLGVPLQIHNPKVEAIAKRLTGIKGVEVTAAQVLLAWAQFGGRSVIPKSVTPSRIRANFQEIAIDDEAFQEIKKIGESPQRFNVPTTYRTKWDIDIFGDEREKSATQKVILKL